MLYSQDYNILKMELGFVPNDFFLVVKRFTGHRIAKKKPNGYTMYGNTLLNIAPSPLKLRLMWTTVNESEWLSTPVSGTSNKAYMKIDGNHHWPSNLSTLVYFHTKPGIHVISYSSNISMGIEDQIVLVLCVYYCNIIHSPNW